VNYLFLQGSAVAMNVNGIKHQGYSYRNEINQLKLINRISARAHYK
jgi:hypothetical protein